MSISSWGTGGIRGIALVSNTVFSNPPRSVKIFSTYCADKWVSRVLTSNVTKSKWTLRIHHQPWNVCVKKVQYLCPQVVLCPHHQVCGLLRECFVFPPVIKLECNKEWVASRSIQNSLYTSEVVTVCCIFVIVSPILYIVLEEQAIGAMVAEPNDTLLWPLRLNYSQPYLRHRVVVTVAGEDNNSPLVVECQNSEWQGPMELTATIDHEHNPWYLYDGPTMTHPV